MGLIVTEIESGEDCREVLSSDGFVPVQRRGLPRLLDVGKVNGFPEVRHRDVTVLRDSAFAVDLLHLSSSELLNRFAGPAVMLIVFLA